ncbi:MAG TPA: hypothetical protein VJ787_05430 [Thermoleophilia bacterium]|nr:hypothetical protein [Thermoleophilia bacterium]
MIHEALASAALTFTVLSPLPAPEPGGERYSLLFSALDARGGDDRGAEAPGSAAAVDHAQETAAAADFPLAIELIYEGYLLHYRRSRVASPGEHDGSRLLAGDYLYARGLRIVAAAGDVDSVHLLTRLMAVCSYLRAEGVDFVFDDEVWAFTVAALAAMRQGCPVTRPGATFDVAERALAGGELASLPGLLRNGAAALALRDARPLEPYLRGFRAAALPRRLPQL